MAFKSPPTPPRRESQQQGEGFREEQTNRAQCVCTSTSSSASVPERQQTYSSGDGVPPLSDPLESDCNTLASYSLTRGLPPTDDAPTDPKKHPLGVDLDQGRLLKGTCQQGLDTHHRHDVHNISKVDLHRSQRLGSVTFENSRPLPPSGSSPAVNNTPSSPDAIDPGANSGRTPPSRGTPPVWFQLSKCRRKYQMPVGLMTSGSAHGGFTTCNPPSRCSLSPHLLLLGPGASPPRHRCFCGSSSTSF
ncbi:unnamed protein product [Pleuronectes platessa]|uniref:Uncharacterized protein n=1 Tax=Pleuronectes platessa TaxID=8262 RepID=A0A9N7UYB4_PLEPL|nr:unnamed protein product [Pleuronectes platessa]